MSGSEKEGRRWVKGRAQDYKEYCRHQTETIKPGVSFRSSHPTRVLQQAAGEWTKVWTARIWASQHGVRQGDILDAYGFAKHGGSRLSGLMRIHSEAMARKLWAASGSLADAL